MRRATAQYVTDAMVEAVLFAWGHTLVIWAPDDEPREEARRLGSTTHALLEALRKRGLKLGVVSNALDPPEPLHRELADSGIAERIDYAVFAAEVGRPSRTPRSSSARSTRSALPPSRRSSSATGSRRTCAAPGSSG